MLMDNTALVSFPSLVSKLPLRAKEGIFPNSAHKTDPKKDSLNPKQKDL